MRSAQVYKADQGFYFKKPRIFNLELVKFIDYKKMQIAKFMSKDYLILVLSNMVNPRKRRARRE